MTSAVITRRALFALSLVAGLLLFGATGYAWSRGESGITRDSGAARSGRDLFLSKGCAACHDIADKDIVAGFDAGPDLSGLAENAALRAGDQPVESYVRASILAPDAYVVPGYGGGWGMPQLALTPEELDALVVFLLKGDVP